MGYKFRSYDIEDKIKYAKPNSFFETIRHNFKKQEKIIEILKNQL